MGPPSRAQSPGPAASADLVILGASVAGLAAARRASARGLSVMVLESSQTVGGLAASSEVAGVRVDLGSHRIQATIDSDLLADLQHLLGADLQRRRRRGRVQVLDRWLSFPLRPVDLATKLPGKFTATVARDALVGAARRDRSQSYAGVLRSGLGPVLYDAIYGPYADKVWGIEGEGLDAEQARRRVDVTSTWQLAGRLRRRSPDPAESHFWYPRRGFGQIVEALADAVTDSGGAIHCGVSVNSVRARPDGVRLQWDGGQVHAGQLFSTLPLQSLGRVARPAPSAQVVQDAAGLSFRGVVLVYLVHEGGRWTEFDAHYLPGQHTSVTRVSEPMNFRESLEDPRDRTVLCAEIPCTVGDDMWTTDDAVLGDLVVEGLRRSGLPPIQLQAVEVKRIAKVYPVYRQGYRERLGGLMGWADRLANVTTMGRLGLFAHESTHRELRLAYDAADCLRPHPAGSVGFDHLAWQLARERLAALRGEG